MGQNKQKVYNRLVQATVILASLLLVILVLSASIIYLTQFYTASPEISQNLDKTHETVPVAKKEVKLKAEEYGFINDEGVNLVIANCTGCHSSKMVVQNRATREGWKSMIIWMQETQNLWELGKNEELILDYLSKNYAPENKGRRAVLSNIEWYVLEE